MSFLQVQNVSKRFGGLQALSSVSFEVQRGETLGLIGPNGAGKTTLFNVVSGFLPPDTGRVIFDGRDLRPLRPDRIVAIGLVRTFQNVRLFRERTVLENVMIGAHRLGRQGLLAAALRLPGVGAEEHALHERALETLRYVGLEDLAAARADVLSAGAQRLVEVARALASDPLVLMLDEPAAGLNETETDELIRLMGRLRERGITVAVVEHHLGLVMRVSDRVVVLSEGRKLAEGPPAAVRADPLVVRAYIGEA